VRSATPVQVLLLAQCQEGRTESLLVHPVEGWLGRDVLWFPAKLPVARISPSPLREKRTKRL